MNDHPRRRVRSALRRRRSKSWTAYVLPSIAAVLLMLVVIVATIALSWFLPENAEVVVPPLIGDTYPEAQAIANGGHLRLQIVARRADPQAPKDTIIGQLPPAGERVRQGRIVELIISDGLAMVQVPSVSQMSLSEATVAIENARLKLGDIALKQDSSVPTSAVLAQRPDPFSVVRSGTKVDLVVAHGRALARVPNFIGLPIAFARSAAKQFGIVLGKIQQMPIRQGALAKDLIDEQDPPPGEVLLPKQTIALRVSGGAPPTPTPSPTATGLATSTPSLPLPTAERAVRIAVWLPLTSAKRNIRIVLEDAVGSSVLYDQATLGGFTLSFNETVRGAATVETYSDDALINATPL